MVKEALIGLIGTLLLGGVAAVVAADPVALRIANMQVAPAHMPAVKVWISNQSDKPYEGSATLQLPDGWTLAPSSQKVALRPGETTSVSFTIHDGKTREVNRYPLVAVVNGAGGEVRRSQEIVCASAPYFKPEIDGNAEDWKDSIPVAFATQGQHTTISTFWNRRQFSMLVAVEEDHLVPPGQGQPFDAVQIAISPQNTQAAAIADQEATRFEFLLASGGAGERGRCYRLAEPGMKLDATQARRALEGSESEGSELAVWRQGNTTFYEWSVPFRSLTGIKPSEGREFFLSVLVHDPDGTGLRDWGEAAGLWPCQRNRLAWSDWPGAVWPQTPPMDNKLEWGMCSSKY